MVVVADVPTAWNHTPHRKNYRLWMCTSMQIHKCALGRGFREGVMPAIGLAQTALETHPRKETFFSPPHLPCTPFRALHGTSQ